MANDRRSEQKCRVEAITTLLAGVVAASCLVFAPSLTHAQMLDLLLKGGHVIDPRNDISAPMDVGIIEDRIARVAVDIPESSAKRVIDVSGLFVVPGLIDLHTHVFVGSNPGFADGFSSLSPDNFTFRAGVTTVVDAGTSGWQNFPTFKAQVIDRSQTRVLAWLNIFPTGFGSGSAIEPEMNTLDVQRTAETIEKYRDFIVGTRIGHYSGTNWAPFDSAVEAAQLTDAPLLVECHLKNYSLQDQLDRMRPGDILTHAFEQVSERLPVVDEHGVVRPFVLEAQKKGILFDVGHGGSGFWFSQAIPALEQGLAPNSFGTDLHRSSMNAGMKDMLNIMSKYLNMGMSMEDLVLRGSWSPAQAIKREDLGHLSEGAVADIAVLRIREGEFGFLDARNNRLKGDQRLEAELTIRAGRIRWDLNGLAGRDIDLEDRLPNPRR